MEQGVASTKDEVMSEEERKNLECVREFQRLENKEFYREKAALKKAALESKKCRNDSEGETTSQSSEEPVISTELPEKKGNKKNVQVSLDTSPNDVSEGNKDAEMQGQDDEVGLRGFTPPSNFLDDFVGSPMFSEHSENSFKNLSSQLKYLGDKDFFLRWDNAKGFPKLVPMEVSTCDMEEYIERVLTHSHK